MEMAIFIAAAGIGTVLQGIAVFMTVRNVKHQRTALLALGKEYAKLAVSHSDDPRAQLDAFLLIDRSADGKRDFTDAQARLLLDEARAAK